MSSQKITMENSLEEEVLALSQSALWYLDLASKEITFSASGKSIIGLVEKQDSLSLDEFFQLADRHDKKQLQHCFKECEEFAQAFLIPIKIVNLNNRQKHIELIGRRVAVEGVPTAIEGGFRDLSELKGLEAKLSSQSQARQDLSNLLQAVSIIIRTDTKGTVTYVNERFEEVTGYKQAEIIGENVRILRSSYHPKSFYQSMWQKVSSGTIWTGEIKNTAKDGSHYWVDSLIQPLTDEDGKISSYLSVQRDISKAKIATEMDLRTANLVALGESSAQIMHDVMNPLSVVAACEERLLGLNYDEDIKEDITKIAGIISRNIQRIHSIFQDIRETMSGDTKMSALQLNDVLEKSIGGVQHVLDQLDVSITYQLDRIYPVVGHPGLLEQVMSNLIKNAAEAIAELNNRWIRVEVEQKESQTVLKFIDSGEGIPEKVQEKMFESFFTTKNKKGGTGLGLGLCKKIMTLHGGDIIVNNESDHTELDLIFKNLS